MLESSTHVVLNAPELLPSTHTHTRPLQVRLQSKVYLKSQKKNKKKAQQTARIHKQGNVQSLDRSLRWPSFSRCCASCAINFSSSGSSLLSVCHASVSLVMVLNVLEPGSHFESPSSTLSSSQLLKLWVPNSSGVNRPGAWSGDFKLPCWLRLISLSSVTAPRR